jgi:hypothetical protein
MKDGEVIDRIERGEKPADFLVMGVNQIAAQAINISSSPAQAGDRISVVDFRLWHFSDRARCPT